MAKIKIDPKKGKTQTQQRMYKTVTFKPKEKSSSSVEFQRGKSKTTFEKQDVRTGDPNYGKESMTKPTPAFVQKAQRAGAEFAEKDGKSYVAGKSTTTKEPDKVKIKIKLSPDLKMSVPEDPKPMQKGKDNVKQPAGPAKKRRLERVKWLEGRNKRTESGFGR